MEELGVCYFCKKEAILSPHEHAICVVCIAKNHICVSCTSLIPKLEYKTGEKPGRLEKKCPNCGNVNYCFCKLFYRKKLQCNLCKSEYKLRFGKEYVVTKKCDIVSDSEMIEISDHFNKCSKSC